MSNYIKLHANCIIVSGLKRSVLCDLQRFELFSIPDGIVEIFTEHKEFSLDAIYKIYDTGIHSSYRFVKNNILFQKRNINSKFFDKKTINCIHRSTRKLIKYFPNFLPSQFFRAPFIPNFIKILV